MKLLALLALSSTAFAGKAITAPEPPPAPHGYFQSEIAYGAESGGNSEWDGRVQLGIIRPISGIGLLAEKGGQWQLRLGLDHERFEFDHASGLALPSRLQRLAAVVALEYRVGTQVGVRFEARPGVYFQNDIRSNAWNCPVFFGLGIAVNQRFTLALAGRFDAFAEHPFIGGPGFIWRISDALTLSAVPPEPRLIWAASDALDLWLSGEVAGGAFRTDPALGDALVSYSDIRAGVGATWRKDTWTLEASGGVSFEREWDFHRVGTKFTDDEPAPFFKLAARFEW